MTILKKEPPGGGSFAFDDYAPKGCGSVALAHGFKILEPKLKNPQTQLGTSVPAVRLAFRFWCLGGSAPGYVNL
jgi:hypothetical protein